MNKKELVESVSIERNLTKKEAELLVDTVFNTITRSVVEGDKVLISGFGTFKVNDRKARKGISPKTQKEMIIPASKTVTFKPSNNANANNIYFVIFFILSFLLFTMCLDEKRHKKRPTINWS